MGTTGAWNIDMSRAARETLPNYARLSYYEIWITALEKLLAERGLALADELATGHMLHPPLPVSQVLRASNVAAALAKGSPTERPAAAAARFKPGDRVRARAAHVEHHTRLPGYVHGHLGVIERVHGPHVFADAHAQGLGEHQQWLYGVVFDGAELWGAEATPSLRVSIDAWEPTLDAP
jgi:nitrile hydratase